MSQRGYVIAFLLVLLAAFAGAFFGGRYLLERITSRPGGATARATITAYTPQASAALTTPAPGQPTTAATAAPRTATVPPVPTLRGILTPFVPPTPTFEPTATEAPATATPLPATTTVTPTATSTGNFAFVLARAVRNTSGDCAGNLILGSVTNSAGAPLPGVRLHLTDEFGAQNDFKATKSVAPDTGKYDFPLFGAPRRFYIQVVDDAGLPLSEKVEVPHGVGPDAKASCHWVDWVRR